MTENLPTTRRWRRLSLFAIVGALGAGRVASGALFSTGSQDSLPAAVRLAAASKAGAGSADQAAVNYVDSHYPGPGAAQLLKTEPDVDRGVAVYDVRVAAPNGTTYVVHVQQSNEAVLFANPAEY
ncbi:MAG: PepSY domain-containing protein [Acidimicrobiales bacterium]